jgi:hypothetical protein
VSSAPLIGVSASLHDFGDYGGIGVHRPVLLAGGLPMTLPQLPDAIAPALDAIDALVLAPGRDIEPKRSSCPAARCWRCSGSFRRSGGSTAASCGCSSGLWGPRERILVRKSSL